MSSALYGTSNLRTVGYVWLAKAFDEFRDRVEPVIELAGVQALAVKAS